MVDINAQSLQEALQVFGHEGFRPGQQDAIESLVNDGRLLLVAPTGGGKSLSYQLPATLLPGTTIVISPLIALMQDQVASLVQLGIKASYLASTLSNEEMRSRLNDVRRGRYKIVYISPERLALPEFRALLADLKPPLLAVDEAHCISEWGHDFRPEYMQIGEVVASLPQTKILACTATATPVVRDEILNRLGLPASTKQMVQGFARPNLALAAREALSKKERLSLIDGFIQKSISSVSSPIGSVIIYAPTRKSVDEESTRLKAMGWRCAGYHAGLNGDTRSAVHHAFSDKSLDIVVATNAFGMGIDRSDVRGVLHMAPPSSVEAYYQEVGRAGRDGGDAYGLLLTAPKDFPLRRRLLERGVDGEAVPTEVVEHKWNLFLELMRWAEGGACRHDAILRYFGDDDEVLSGCAKCDVCLGESPHDERPPEEVLLFVRKMLSGVARIHNRFGLSAANALLRGVDDPRLQRTGLNRSSTFGILKNEKDKYLGRVLRRLVTAGWVNFVGDEHPMAVLTDEGKAVMRGERKIRFLLPPKNIKNTETHRQNTVQHDELDAAALEVFEALRVWRRDVAQSRAVPPYVVASDRTLRDIAMLRPRNDDELLLAHGIGATKVKTYGQDILNVVNGA